jgi:biotin carboxyl carrier protein
VTYIADGEEFAVAYRLTGGLAPGGPVPGGPVPGGPVPGGPVPGGTVEATVNDVPLGAALLLHAAAPDLVDLEVDGLRRVYLVHRVGAQTYVDASNGSSGLSEVPRFGQPDKLAPTGSLLAPMPGLVLRVLAEVGATVAAGQPLVVLEAMKMEQTVTAPADGVLAELRAKAGEQVAAGQILAVVDAQGQQEG